MMSEKLDVRKACHVVTHPILEHKLTHLRDRRTSASDFRRILGEVSRFLAYEVTRDLKTRLTSIETPLESAELPVIAEEVLIVAVMRAGNGMLDGVLQILPFAKVGHIGIYRDKFLQSTVEYYLRLPKGVEKDRALLLDPLLATGDTALAAVERLKEYGVGSIDLLSILSSPDGIRKVKEFHPDVRIHTLAIDAGLDAQGMIRPGLGDAGDRLYDTL